MTDADRHCPAAARRVPRLGASRRARDRLRDRRRRSSRPDDVGLQLLENAAATAAGLFAIILMFGPVSGGALQPGRLARRRDFGGMRWRDALAYIPAQVAGCITGASPPTRCSRSRRSASPPTTGPRPPHLFAEVIATLGLLLVIFSLARTRRGSHRPAAVGAYIGAAYFFTSSTSFANPAITVGRMFSDTFAGIAPAARSSSSSSSAARRDRRHPGALPGYHRRRGRRDPGPPRGGAMNLTDGPAARESTRKSGPAPTPSSAISTKRRFGASRLRSLRGVRVIASLPSAATSSPRA